MRHLKVFMLMTMVLMGWAWGQTAPEFGQIWHDSEQNPTYREYRIDSTWNEGGIGFTTWGHAMWDGEQYRLYVSRSGPLPDRTHSIGVFFTSDLDSAWVPHENNPIFEPSSSNWDSSDVATPMVIKDGDTYKMWYSGWHPDVDDWHMGYAESSDGIAWTRHPSPILSSDANSGWDSYWGLAPYVIKESDNDYIMYYAGQNGTSFTWKIGCAHSTDGVNWAREVENPILGVDGPWSTNWVHIPVVKKIDEEYIMWFAGAKVGVDRAQIGTAISSDGIHWRKDHLYNPIQTQGLPGEWNEVGSYPVEVFEEDGVYKLFYGGIDESWEYVGYGNSEYNPTIVPAGDVSGTWTKAGSPIRVQGEITIPDGQTLTIEPGTTVEFVNPATLWIDGRLLAQGTEGDRIRFRVADTLGYHDYDGGEGVWGGLRFASTPATNDSSYLSHCDVEYGNSLVAGNNHGGGIKIGHFSKLRIENCLIQYNHAVRTNVGGEVIGGGISIDYDSNPEIVNNIIQYNSARHLSENKNSQGGGISLYDNCDPLISGNIIRGNYAQDTGGGLFIWTNCDPELENNLIVENTAVTRDGLLGYGGGVCIGSNSHPIFINNTIANNEAVWGGGGVYFHSGYATFINTIIANNTRLSAGDGEAWGHDMAMYGNTMASHTIDIQNSCLEGGKDLIMWGAGNTGTPGGVNFEESLSVDPQLTQAYTLMYASSPCLGAGTPSCTIDGVTYNALPQDVYGHVCPDPPGSLPDMGAIESVLSGHIITSAWDWWEWPESPVFTPGASGTYDDDKVFAPDVLFHEGQYHMWYVGDDGPRFRICHATSVDGVEWVRDPANPVLISDPTTWQDNDLNVPRVLIMDGVFNMWFHSNDRVGHATSTDGIDWTFSPDPVLEGSPGTWDSDQVFVSDVIYLDTLFHAWYTGKNSDVWGIGHATSTDGIEWVKDVDNNPVFGPSESGWDNDMFYASSVVYNGGYFYMWYCSSQSTNYNRIGRASSLNGINWIRTTAAEPEIGYGEAGSWNDEASFYPAALLHQGKYEIWFNGAPSSTSGWRIGYATMEPVATDPQYIEMPQSFMLSQNYPNPFNPMTHIRYSLPENGDMRLVIYDLLGREVLELVNDFRSVGNYETTWYGLDQQGNQVSTGVYFARLEAGRNVDVIKMLYLK